jgi:hypothetical protein
MCPWHVPRARAARRVPRIDGDGGIDRSIRFFRFAAGTFHSSVSPRTEVAPARAALTQRAHVGCSADTTCAAAAHMKMTDDTRMIDAD